MHKARKREIERERDRDRYEKKDQLIACHALSEQAGQSSPRSSDCCEGDSGHEAAGLSIETILYVSPRFPPQERCLVNLAPGFDRPGQGWLMKSCFCKFELERHWHRRRESLLNSRPWFVDPLGVRHQLTIESSPTFWTGRASTRDDFKTCMKCLTLRLLSEGGIGGYSTIVQQLRRAKSPIDSIQHTLSTLASNSAPQKLSESIW